ncbi:DUF3572 domain-containing protein [Tianweitania populi]|uniref:DUF3572 family protein n=1 Tax=Tianweitania populi TaxID=1607949 RepID=A0A8J3DNF0_9HYPH|nr:DUF3572 domain-containing protein [Tianweitania populi]GHD09013.1 hypothetical protein GCM10016234_09320 [Tianweitania populi]
MTRDLSSAESIGVSALGFIAADPELLGRFLAITGIEPAQIRQAATEPGFLAGVLDFVLAHEPTLLAFASSSDLDPAAILKARRTLPNGSDDYDRSI